MTGVRQELAKHTDLFLLIVLAVTSTAAVVIGLPPAVRLVFVLPLIFFGSGYALMVAVLPAHPLPPGEQLLVAIGGSLAITIVAGLLLAVSPLGLGPLPWTLVLAAVTVVGTGVGWARRTTRGLEGPRLLAGPVPWRDVLPVALAAVAAVAILLGTRAIAAQQEPPPPAQLWMLPAADRSTNAQLGVRASSPGSDYVVRITTAGTLLAEYTLTLQADETWQSVVTLNAEERQRPVVARLFESGEELELRFVVLQPMSDDS